MPIRENRSVIVSRDCKLRRASYGRVTWFDEFFLGKRSSIWIDDEGICHDFYTTKLMPYAVPLVLDIVVPGMKELIL